MNWLLTANEAGTEESKFKFVSTAHPANAQFIALPVPADWAKPNRGEIEVRGRAFALNGNRFIEVFADGSITTRDNGGLESDTAMGCLVANGNGQIFIASATASSGAAYVYNLGTNLLSAKLGTFPGSEGFLGASYATFQDGYILTIVPNSNQFQISGTDDAPTGDATKWDASNVSVQAGQADNLVAIISSREYVRILGARRSQVYQNVGANGIGGFPFQSYNETFIETGCAAPFSLNDLGDSLIWIGQDARGQRACWRDGGFQPQRVSTFAVERWWQNYTRVDDAVAFSFIWQGRLLYQITFPHAGLDASGNVVTATWIYDITNSALVGKPVWIEGSYMAPNGGLQSATGIAPGRAEVSHCYAFGKHLVGSGGADGNPGAIYQLSDAVFTDCGADPISGDQIQQPIVCDRIAPHGPTWGKRSVHNRIEFELERGVGNAEDPGMNPQLLLRWSNDGGKTFGTEYQLPMGLQGQYSIWVYLLQLGYANHPGRVYWVRCADPVFNSLMNCTLDYYDLAS